MRYTTFISIAFAIIFLVSAIIKFTTDGFTEISVITFHCSVLWGMVAFADWLLDRKSEMIDQLFDLLEQRRGE